MDTPVIKHAEFMLSAVRAAGWPPAGPPEVAFVGRSNVGKSSLINRLVNRKKLVRTSSKPGCTQQINFFSFNQEQFRLVDLPGYGFAKVPRALKATWGAMIEEYLLNRASLRGVVALLDIRRDLSADDLNLLNWFQAHQVPWLTVFTKTDKLSHNQIQKQLAALKRQMPAGATPPLLFSAVTGLGAAELWQALSPWLREAPPARQPG